MEFEEEIGHYLLQHKKHKRKEAGKKDGFWIQMASDDMANFEPFGLYMEPYIYPNFCHLDETGNFSLNLAEGSKKSSTVDA